MTFTPELIVSLISFAATVIVGFILAAKIKSQKSTIDGLKTLADTMKMLNEMYDFEKMKSYTKIVEKEAEGKYKDLFGIRLKEELSKFDKEAHTIAAERYIGKNVDFIESYEEIMSIPISIMLPMSHEQREGHLKHYPKSASVLRKFLQAIDNGEVAPGSSVLKKPPKPKKTES